MTTDITELAQREKFEAWFVNDVVGTDVTFPTFEDGEYSEGEIYDEQLYFTLQAMWMAWKAAGAELVEALEKAQRANAAQDDHINQQQDRIDQLEKKNAGLGKYAGELETIRAAAEKLVRCKGRYHSEQNYRALAAMFGVTTPDLPQLEHENVHYADAAEMEIAALRQRIAELESHKAALLKFIRESCYVFDGYDADISDAYTDAASSSLMPKIEAEPCHHCSDGSYSGLPGGACEHCMGTGLDDPAAELESLAVKLPEPFKLAKSSSGLTYYYADEVNEALSAAGIKWEAE